MITRRKLVIALGAGSVSPPPAALSQQARKIPLIGYLHPGFSATPITVATVKTLREGLSAAGYVDGKTVRIEFRFANGKSDALPGLAQELVQMKVDVLVMVSPSALSAARAATASTPIVALDLETDPVAGKLAASLARPGGNITGQFLNHTAMTAKWLQMLQEVAPVAKRIAVLWDVNTGAYQRTAITAAATAVSVEIDVLKFGDSSDIEGVLDVSLKRKPQALLLLGSPLNLALGREIAGFAAKHRLPGISPFRTFSDAGGLMSYGPILTVMYRSLASQVVKILNGAKPGDLPIEQPTHFEFVINRRAAAELGITLPRSLLLRADEVIG